MPLCSMTGALDDLIKTVLSDCLGMLLGSAVQLGKAGQVHPRMKHIWQRLCRQSHQCPSVLPFVKDYVGES